MRGISKGGHAHCANGFKWSYKIILGTVVRLDDEPLNRQAMRRLSLFIKSSKGHTQRSYKN